MNRVQLRETLAKGYFHKENEDKSIDLVLIDAMIDELIGEDK